MSWLTVWVCAVGLLVQKVAGAFVPRTWVQDPRVRGVLALLPVAMFAALTLTQVAGGGDGLVLDLRLVGLGAAAVCLLLRAPFLVVVVVGAAATAVVRLVL
ncbi:AzlD domain-containing protein [Aquipuribacter sp. SD81]|uniref:AzlD domain-containing protein n=1 Tax=Aquipuribacter sp. SD81 TaxID=3127703 RepID=UPI0030187E74